MRSQRWAGRLLFAACVAAMAGVNLACGGCGRDSNETAPARSPVAVREESSGIAQIDLPSAEQRAGTAVVILVDTSGSMSQSVADRGKKARPKSQIARDALGRIIELTAEWKKAHPDRTLQMGILTFASSPAVALPLGDFNEAGARAALARIPAPNGGTAIGSAMEEGFKALYRSGCIRKYLICVTDGENTSGLPPDRVARQLFAQTKGEVEIHFVAFDVSARHFDFLKSVNGQVAQASDGEQLQAELRKIYDKRILVEAESPEK
jgi:Mg-chelatase subunit ChlD